MSSEHLLSLGSGPPLVFIGGLHGHHEFQRPIVERLRHDFRVLCPSLPGDCPTRISDLESAEAVAGELLERLAATGLETFSLCGISMGGLIALQMALLAPRRVSRLGVIQSFAEYNFLHPRLKQVYDFFTRNRWDRTGTFVSRSALLALTIRDLVIDEPSRPQVREYWERFKRYGSPGRLITVRLKMVRKASLLDRLSELSMPLLLVAAERDVLVQPSHLSEIAKRTPQSQLVMIPASGHLFPFFHPERLAEVIVPFFKHELQSTNYTN
ncbi:MAG TPA: alpha/beta hydrolase [Acidobacteriota bacterium]|jgi:3-oxoadipate enol-lactonase